MLKHVRSSVVAIVGVLLSIFISGCEKNMVVALDSDRIDALTLTTIDSITPEVSTVVMPNVPTSGLGAILVGKFTRNAVGSVSSSSYFRVVPENFANDIPAGASFDSLNLVIRPHSNRLYYGDTTQMQRIAVHRVIQPLERTTLTPGGIMNTVVPIYVEQASIFGDQRFAVDETPLGELSFRASVMPQRSLSVRLDNAMGQEVFDKFVQNTLEVQSEENFIEYLHGLAIVPDANNTSLIAYNDTVQANIAYSYLGSDGFRQTGTKTLVIRNYEYKYNHFDYDGTGTAFETLAVGNPVSHQETNGIAQYQAGTGLAVKITFPGLRDFLATANMAINKVELEVEVQTAQEYLYPIASSPVLLLANAQNIPVNVVPSPFSTTIQQGQYIPGNNTGRNGRFVFNLIQYIQTLNDPNQLDNSLLLAVGPQALTGSVSSGVIPSENNRPKIKLNIFYTKFE